MVPLHWLSKEQAEYLGYQKVPNYDLNYRKIFWNQEIVSFSLANISKNQNLVKNVVAVRLESSLLRIRLTFFKILLVAFSSFPIVAAISCMLMELCYLVYVVIIAIKYRYLKTIIIAISRVNVSLTILILTSIATYLSLVQDKKIKASINCPLPLQMIGVLFMIVCVVFELVLLLALFGIKICVLLYTFVSDRRNANRDKGEHGNTTQKKSILPFVEVWMIKREEPVEPERKIPTNKLYQKM